MFPQSRQMNLRDLSPIRKDDTVLEARLCAPPDWLVPAKRASASFKLGMRYERKGHKYFKKLYEEKYIQSPWIYYETLHLGKKWCQPDGLLFCEINGKPCIGIVEFKTSHCMDAYIQLVEIYSPLVRKIYGEEYGYFFLEVVKWYDAKLKIPVKPHFLRKLEDIRPGQYGIHIWNDPAGIL